MIKKLIISFLIVIIFFTSGCALNNKESKNDEVNVVNFDNEISSEIARNYMHALAISDMEGMKALSTQELAQGLTKKPSNDLKITGIRLEESTQKGLNALYKYTVSKAKESEPIAELETYYIKVKKEEDKYKISSVKSVLDYELFKAETHLKIRTDDKVEINNVVKLKNIPNLAYIKSNKGDITKVPVPKDDYGAVGISYTGQKIGVATKSGNSTYVCLIEVDTAKPTIANDPKQEGAEGNKKNAMEDLVEDEDKLVGKKITTLDIYNDVTITNFMFTKDDTHVAVTYDKNNVKGFDFYQCGGDLIDLKLRDTFEENRYQITFRDYIEDDVFFNVEGVKNVKGVEQSLIGSYKISTKDFKLTKL